MIKIRHSSHTGLDTKNADKKNLSDPSSKLTSEKPKQIIIDKLAGKKFWREPGQNPNPWDTKSIST